MSELFPENTYDWPYVTLQSIYVLYPNKQDRRKSIQRIREALIRICEGEIDGKPRTMQESVDFLRQKTHEACTAFYGREKKWIPHSTTWFNQSKYLTPNAPPEELPNQLEACVNVLSVYPGQPNQKSIRSDVKAFLPTLKSIDKALESIPLLDLMKRVKLFRDCVLEWPKEELRYVPAARRWFEEQRWNQPEELWRRNTGSGYEDERSQLGRILGNS